MRLYGDLAAWWPVLTPLEGYAPEAQEIRGLLGPCQSLLELGCGAGLLAAHWPDLRRTLVDLSPEMLALAAAHNPDATVVQGDLRTLRRNEHFDAVLLHDAAMYLLDDDDLDAAIATAAAHLHPGGVFLAMPDFCADDFEEDTLFGGGEDGGRAARLTEWRWDPDPDDSTFQLEFSLLLREGATMRAVHESHTMGMFPRRRWWERLLAQGFTPWPHDPSTLDAVTSEVLRCRR